MSKRTVRLTESELKNIITESVKNIISELDWKTYMNAGKKRLAQRGENEKYANGFDLLNQAEKSFNRDYGSNIEYDKNFDRREWFDNPEEQGITRTYGTVAGQYDGRPQNIRMQSNTDVSTPNSGGRPYETLTSDPKRGTFITGVGSSDPDSYDIEDMFFRGYGIDKEKEPLLADMIKQNHYKAKDEVRRYESGKYDYTKGKGWHLKDK